MSRRKTLDPDVAALRQTLAQLGVRPKPTPTPKPKPVRRRRPRLHRPKGFRGVVIVRAPHPKPKRPGHHWPRARLWQARCTGCGIAWTTTLDPSTPACVRAALAVIRVPCPVCWALRYRSAAASERSALAGVPALWPSWR